MAFNIDTATISLYLAAEAEFNGQNEDHEKLLYALYCFALKRPLSRQLANQEFPHHLERIARAGSHNAPWVHDALARGEPVWQFRPDDALSAHISHVADWIAAAVTNNEPWLMDRDPRGAPRKLTKFGSLEQATREADKAMIRRNGPLPAHLAPEHFTIEKAFPDGAKIVRLLTPEALDAESAQMRHCIGHGAYDHKLEHGTCSFFSLRSPSGKTCATMEVNTAANALIQCRGPLNDPPLAKYTPYIHEFVDEKKLALHDSPMMTGLIQSGGRTYDVRNLPQNLVYNGDLRLSGTLIHKLPDGLHVTGNLDISVTGIKELPERLRVDRDLDASFTPLTQIPPDMAVAGLIDLSHTKITSLPANFRPPQHLELSHTPIQELPENFSVAGNLHLVNSDIAKLPPGLKVGGTLDLFDAANLRALPQDIKVGRNLVLARTSIDKLPDGLTVGNNLDLSDTRISILPHRLTVFGALTIDDTPLKEIPADSEIGHSLSAERTHLRTLPENLRIPGNLYLAGAKIDTLPRNLVIGQKVIVDTETRLPHLPRYFAQRLHRQHAAEARTQQNSSYEQNTDLEPEHE